MNKEENFIARVREERELQKKLWPEPHDSSHSWMEWSAILSKYLGRYSAEACNNDFLRVTDEYEEHIEEMEDSIVKLAAVAMACYEKL